MVVFTRKRPKAPRERQKNLALAIGILTLVALSMLGAFIAYYYTPPRLTPCELVEGLCLTGYPARRPSVPQRQYTDQEVAAMAVAREFLTPPRKLPPPAPKVAFMYLTPGPMPLEFVWEDFFKGHEDKYTVYVHASELDTLKSVWKSKVFIGREIPSGKVVWGGIEMIDAEKRLLARALMDRDNQFFVLVSDSCIPLYSFEYIYESLINSSCSFVDNFDDPGPHGAGRYLKERMMPEIQLSDWRKGAQWFAVMRKHAVLLVLDHLYYGKFKDFCKPGNDNRNCYPDEHYVQTYLHIMDPSGLSNWSITYVNWSDRGWHPKSYANDDVNIETLSEIQAREADHVVAWMQRIDTHVHVSSDGKATQTSVPCMWNEEQRPCFLFARKFLSETAQNLTTLLPKMTGSIFYDQQPNVSL